MVKKVGTAVKRWDEELAKMAQETVAAEASVSLGNFISLKSGQMSYMGSAMEGNKMTVVVIDAVLENTYYEDAYDPDNPASPVCFAFGRDDKTLVPHDDSEKKQADQCKGCPQNEFGTAERGKGKACKNSRRLAVITEEGLDDIEGAELAYLKIPVTSVKAWSGYAQQLASTMNLPPLGVKTEISVVPDAKSQFKVHFKFVEKVDEEHYEALFARKAGGEAALMKPYQPIEKKEAPPAKAARKFRK